MSHFSSFFFSRLRIYSRHLLIPDAIISCIVETLARGKIRRYHRRSTGSLDLRLIIFRFNYHNADRYSFIYPIPRSPLLFRSEEKLELRFRVLNKIGIVKWVVKSEKEFSDLLAKVWHRKMWEITFHFYKYNGPFLFFYDPYRLSFSFSLSLSTDSSYLYYFILQLICINIYKN